MKISKEEFNALKKDAINCLATPYYVKYRLKNKLTIVANVSGFYVYEKIRNC